MKSEKKILLIIVAVLSIPAILFFLKPEVNVENKYIKFSWKDGIQDIRQAIEHKNAGELADKIYGNFKSLLKSSVINQKVDSIYYDYMSYSRSKARKFIEKCKTFIS